MPAEIHIFTDGGSRGNPGPGAAAFVVKDPQGATIYQAGNSLGVVTNNQAEYAGVLAALKWLQGNMTPAGQTSVIFFLDSLVVASQLAGTYKINDLKLKILHAEIQKLIANCQLLNVKFVHIPRIQNFQADLLVNQTLDQVLSH